MRAGRQQREGHRHSPWQWRLLRLAWKEHSVCVCDVEAEWDLIGREPRWPGGSLGPPASTWRAVLLPATSGGSCEGQGMRVAEPMGPAPPQQSDREGGQLESASSFPRRLLRKGETWGRRVRARPGVRARAWHWRESQQHCVPHRPRGLLLVSGGQLPVSARDCSCRLLLGCAISSGPQTFAVRRAREVS